MSTICRSSAKLVVIALAWWGSISPAEQGQTTLPTPINGGGRPGGVTSPKPPTTPPPAPKLPTTRPVAEKPKPKADPGPVNLTHVTGIRDLSMLLLKNVRRLQTQLELINESTKYVADGKPKADFEFTPLKVKYPDPSKPGAPVEGEKVMFQTVYDLGGMLQAIYAMSQATVGGAGYIFTGARYPSNWADLKTVPPFNGLAKLINDLKPVQMKSWGSVTAYLAGVESALAGPPAGIPGDTARINIAPLRPNGASPGYLKIVENLVDIFVAKYGENGNPDDNYNLTVIGD